MFTSEEAWQEYLQLIERLGLSLGEARILTSVGLSIGRLDLLVEITVAESENAGPFGSVSSEEAQAGLAACFAKGWLRIVDEQVLEELRSLLQMQGVTDCEGCLPYLGEVDFPFQGLQVYRTLYLEWNCPDWDDEATCSHFTAAKEICSCRTIEGALNIIDYYRHYYSGTPAVISISAPMPIGPWCHAWWEVFPSGYRVDVAFACDLTANDEEAH